MTMIKVGPKNAVSDGDLRFYEWKGERYPSVTTIRRMAGLSFGLHQWALGKVVDRAVDENVQIAEMLARAGDDEKAIKAVKSYVRKAATAERDVAANLGSRIHDATDGGPVDDQTRPYVAQYLDWLHKSRAEVLYSERQIWNLKLGYAGQFDRIVRLTSGEVIVVDLKSGKGTYTDHAIQLMAYAFGEFIGEDDVIDEAATNILLSASGVALLHLQPDGWKWQRVGVTPELFQAFRGLLYFAKFTHAHPTITDLLVVEKSGAA